MEIQETPRTGRKAASSIPPAFPGATHITRVVLHPYGRSQSPSYTLSLYDTGIPLPDAHGHYYGYRLYEHFRGAPSTVLFSGSDYRGTSTGEAVLDLINRLTTRPGDTTAEHTFAQGPRPPPPVRARCAHRARGHTHGGPAVAGNRLGGAR
jgi:hypothetical protein